MEVLLVGLLYIALRVVIAAIIVYAIIWLCNFFGFGLPAIIVKLLWAVVVIIGLILLIQLLMGVSLPRLL
jgi:hypothetical protein